MGGFDWRRDWVLNIILRSHVSSPSLVGVSLEAFLLLEDEEEEASPLERVEEETPSFLLDLLKLLTSSNVAGRLGLTGF